MKSILYALWKPLLYWLGVVAALSLLSYPGVICITPAAWLLAAVVGQRSATALAGAPARVATLHAAVAGGLFGAITGLIFLLFMTLAPQVQPDERSGALLLGLGAVLVGAVFSAALAALMVILVRRRRG